MPSPQAYTDRSRLITQLNSSPQAANEHGLNGRFDFMPFERGTSPVVVTRPLLSFNISFELSSFQGINTNSKFEESASSDNLRTSEIASMTCEGLRGNGGCLVSASV